MNKIGTMAALAGGIVALVFLAGFFHTEKSPEPCLATPVAARPAPAVVPAPVFERQRSADAMEAPLAVKGLLGMTQSPNYKRAGDLSLRVADCTKAEDDLESKLTAIKGEIIDMVMEGTEGSRTCTLSAVIPADQFRAFITELRVDRGHALDQERFDSIVEWIVERVSGQEA